MVPSRLVNLERARAHFGDRADRIAPFLSEGDDVGDAASEALSGLPHAAREGLLDRVLAGRDVSEAPAAVCALAEQVRHVPFWVDFRRVDRGGRHMLRTGIFGGFMLAFRSLVLGYCAPAGNKPLAFSGRLQEQAGRRVAETSRFVQAVCLPGGMRPGGEGLHAAVRVRLMHSQVRRLLKKSPRWDASAWGTPICQFDMSATVLLFSVVVIDGLAKVGVPFTPEEAEDVIHLWRYVGWVLGVREELLPATVAEALAHMELIRLTQAAPDEDSRSLARALMEIPITDAKSAEERARAERFIPVTYAISRFLIGDEYADALGFPKSPWRFAAPAITALFSGTSLLRRLPGVDRVILEAGLGYWRKVVELGLGGEAASFAMPERVPYA